MSEKIISVELFVGERIETTKYKYIRYNSTEWSKLIDNGEEIPFIDSMGIEALYQKYKGNQ